MSTAVPCLCSQCLLTVAEIFRKQTAFMNIYDVISVISVLINILMSTAHM